MLPDGYDPSAPCLKGRLETIYGRLWVVHRLDRDTSGAIAFACSAGAHPALNLLFESRQVAKVYHALVVGNPVWENQAVELPLRANVGHRHRTTVDIRQGKHTLTHFRVLERFRSGCALVESRPQTGRTHQIRTHLYAVGHPIAADELYGDRKWVGVSPLKPGFQAGRSGERPILGRLGLHARFLELANPDSQERLYFEAANPQGFEAALRRLRKFRGR